MSLDATDASRTFLAGASVVLPDRVATRSDARRRGRAHRRSRQRAASRLATHESRVDLSGRVIVPGLHRRARPRRRPASTCSTGRAPWRASPRGCRSGVSPRSVRRRWPARPPCSIDVPAGCRARARRRGGAGHARVLPAHLESNFISHGFPRRAAARSACACPVARTPARRRRRFFGRGHPRR